MRRLAIAAMLSTLLLQGSFVQAEEPTKPTVEPYGFVKLDAAYDSARTDVGDYARWVISEDANDSDSQTNITANETRFGLNLKGPDVDNIKTTGKIEGDFYGGGAENKSNPMLRHAYLQVNWPECGFTLLAGQTSDLVSPLWENTVNYTVGWWVGNLGYRRPQIRATKDLPVSDISKFTVALAAARQIGDAGEFTPGDSGEDSAVPMMQGRVGFSTPLVGDKKLDLGVSGHWGREEFDTDATGTNDDYDTWSVDADMTVPIVSALTLKGEFFVGKNLKALLGGIGQGVNMTTKEEIESIGGWAAFNLQATDKLAFNLGGGLDDPKDGDLNDNDRTQNFDIFGNGYYKITPAVSVALELTYWQTKYKALEKGDSLRTQLAFIYYF